MAARSPALVHIKQDRCMRSLTGDPPIRSRFARTFSAFDVVPACLQLSRRRRRGLSPDILRFWNKFLHLMLRVPLTRASLSFRQ